jgi:hypothetical protein
MQKLSSTDYSYDVELVEKGVTIVLTQIPSGKQKHFFLAGKKSVDSIIAHMGTLTDELCEQWFKEREHGKKKKKKGDTE